MVVKRISSLVSKADLRALQEFLLQEGTVVVRKLATAEPHPATKLQNLHVKLVLRSMKSRSFVQEVFSWGHHYYTLTPEGIEFLRGELGLPQHIMPKTYACPVSQSAYVQQHA